CGEQLLRRCPARSVPVADWGTAPNPVRCEDPILMYRTIKKIFPSSQRRGGAKRRGGQFGRHFRRFLLRLRPMRARASRHPVRAFGAATPPLREGECVVLIIVAFLAVGLLGSAGAQSPP